MRLGHSRTRGFTLIELMIVIAIMAIVMTMSVPLVYKVWHKEPLNKAVRDIVEVCSNARAQAILKGHMTKVVFHPQAKHLEVSGGEAPAPPPTADNADFGPVPTGGGTEIAPPSLQGSGLSAQLSDTVNIDLLDINMSGIEYKDEEIASVRFYPNGTSDEMRLVLTGSKGDQVGIELEVTTGLANVIPDVREWLSR